MDVLKASNELMQLMEENGWKFVGCGFGPDGRDFTMTHPSGKTYSFLIWEEEIETEH